MQRKTNKTIYHKIGLAKINEEEDSSLENVSLNLKKMGMAGSTRNGEINISSLKNHGLGVI